MTKKLTKFSPSDGFIDMEIDPHGAWVYIDDVEEIIEELVNEINVLRKLFEYIKLKLAVPGVDIEIALEVYKLIDDTLYPYKEKK